MKYFLSIVILITACLSTQAQSEEQALLQTVNNFLDGGTNGDADQFRSAFVKEAVQRSIGKNGEVIGMTVESLASKIKAGQKMDRQTKIINWTYSGIAATAVTETAYATSKIIDYLSMVKVNNEWKIVARVYSRINSDEEAQTSAPVAKAATSTKASTAKAAPAKKPKPVADDGW